MNAVVVKYMGSSQGGDCMYTGCGSKNPAVRAAALAIMTSQTNDLLVQQVLGDPKIQAGIAGITQSNSGIYH